MENGSILMNQNSSHLHTYVAIDFQGTFSPNPDKMGAKNQANQNFLSQNQSIHNKVNMKNKLHNVAEILTSQQRVKKKIPRTSQLPDSRQQHKRNPAQQTLIHQSPFLSSDRNLRSRLKGYKVNALVKKFVEKLRKNSIYRKPSDFGPLENTLSQDNKVSQVVVNPTVSNIIYIFSILATFTNCFISTFIITFEAHISQYATNIVSILYLIWLALEISFSLFNFKQISKLQFLVDLLCFASNILRIITSDSSFHILQIFMFIKLIDAFNKLKIVENKLIHFPNQEIYWGLAKMFLSNFFLMHIIAIFLLLMSNYDHDKNWIIGKNIQHTEWIQQYSWAFYWSATTMLTIGFGEIAPANYKEALTLVLIQVFSCMILAYNVNFISKMLSELHMKKIQQEKDKSILRRLIDRNEIQPELESKLSSFIQESEQLERKYYFDEEIEFMAKLPKNLQNDILKESNTTILQQIHFFKNFANKTIHSIAQKLNQMVVHPTEYVCQPQVDNIIILNEGIIGLFPNFQASRFSHIVVDKFVVNRKKSGQLVSMGFVKRKLTHENYKLKSIGYSIIQFINKNQFLEILQKRVADIQFFQAFEDKQHEDFEEDFELIFCEQCKKRHSKFICPRLHYQPIPQQVIFKYLNTVKLSKVSRSQIFYRNKIKKDPLIEFKGSQFQTIRTLSTGKQCSLNFVKLKQNTTIKSEQMLEDLLQNIRHNQVMAKRYSVRASVNMLNMSKSREIQNCIEYLDQATNFEFYLRQANPKQLVRIQFRKNVSRKLNSFVRGNIIKKQKILKDLCFTL